MLKAGDKTARKAEATLQLSSCKFKLSQEGQENSKERAKGTE